MRIQSTVYPDEPCKSFNEQSEHLSNESNRDLLHDHIVNMFKRDMFKENFLETTEGIEMFRKANKLNRLINKV